MNANVSRADDRKSPSGVWPVSAASASINSAEDRGGEALVSLHSPYADALRRWMSPEKGLKTTQSSASSNWVQTRPAVADQRVAICSGPRKRTRSQTPDN